MPVENADTGRWVLVARTGDVPDGSLVGVSVQGVEAVVVNAGGRYRVLGAVCSHAGCSLATDGELEDGWLACLCHGSAFDVETGEVVRPPADEAIAVYAVRVDGDAIYAAVAPTGE